MRTFSLLFAFTLIGICLGCHKEAAPEPADQPVSKTLDVEPVFEGKTLSEWMALTKDKDPKLQRKAAAALGNFGALGVPPLLAMLQDDSDVRRATPPGGEAVDVADRLQDDGFVLREAVAQALGKIGLEAKAAIPTLIALLRDRSYFVQEAASEALGKIGQVEVPSFAQMRQDTEDADLWRVAVLVRLTTSPLRDAAVPALREFLRGENWSQLEHATMFGYIDKATVPTFTKLLKHENIEVRWRAAFILGRIGPGAKAAVPALVESLKDPDRETRWRATVALGSIGPGAKAAVPALIESLKDTRGTDVAEALEQIGIDVKTDTPALTELLKYHVWETRQEAARILGNIGHPARAAIPALTESLKDENRVVRCAAALAAWKITAEAKTVVPLLINLLDDKESLPRHAAAYTLGQIGPEARPAIPALVKLFDDKDQGNVIAASKALGKIGPAAIPAITRFLDCKNENPWIRRQAVFSLWQMGSVAIPSLKELLNDEDDTVRQTAAKALKVIEQFKNMPPPLPGERN